jgi:hypothetical protein
LPCVSRPTSCTTETGTKTEIDGSVPPLFHSASLVPLLPARTYLFGQPGDLSGNCVSVHS